jgi:hypothetical protein
VEHGSTLACRIDNLGLDGCRIRTAERFRAGTRVRVELSFRVRGLDFRVSGLTQWTDARQLAGIHFENVSLRRKDELVEALSEVKEENARRAEELAAEQLAAAKLEAGEKAAALQTVAPQAAARTMTAQAPQQERSLFILPSANGTQAVSQPEAALPGDGGQSAGSGSTGQRFLEQRLAVVPSSGTPQSPARPEAESNPAASPPRKPPGRECLEQSREEVDTTAVIYLVKSGSKLGGRILDLSPSGCRIRTDEDFPVGIYTRVETEFRLEGLPFRFGGVIQSIHDRQNVDIRFLDMSDRKREQIEQLIEEIRELKEQGIEIRE